MRLARKRFIMKNLEKTTNHFSVHYHFALGKKEEVKKACTKPRRNIKAALLRYGAASLVL